MLGWDAVIDMRRNPTARYKWEDVICRMENDKLYAINIIDIDPNTGDLYPDSSWYPWTTGLNDDRWEKIDDGSSRVDFSSSHVDNVNNTNQCFGDMVDILQVSRDEWKEILHRCSDGTGMREIITLACINDVLRERRIK